MPEEPLLVRSEEPVRPFERGAERAVAAIGARRAACEQVERALQPAVQVVEGERRQPAGRELDRQRHPVQPVHDPGDGPQFLLGGRRTGPDAAGPVQEEGRRRDLRGILTGLRQGQRREPKEMFSGQPEGFAAGRQQGGSGAAGEDRVDGVADAVEQMLAVVDDQQAGAVGEDGEAGGEHIAPVDLQIECGGQGVREGGGVGDRRETQDDRRAVLPRDLQREAGLPDAAGTDECDQPFGRQQLAQGPELRFAADQPSGRPAGCVPRCRRRGRGRWATRRRRIGLRRGTGLPRRGRRFPGVRYGPGGRVGGWRRRRAGRLRGGRWRYRCGRLRGRWSAGEDVVLGRVQRGGGVESGLVDQPAPVLPGGVQCPGRLSGGGQRPHQEQDRGLAQGIGG
nr:hypothetical protein [Streptomyces wuyuanensis]